MQHWNTVFLEMFVRISSPLFYPLRFIVERILFSPLSGRDMFTQFQKWHIAWYWSSKIYFACHVTIIITPKISAAKLLWPTLWVMFYEVKFNIICYKCFIDSFRSLVRKVWRYQAHFINGVFPSWQRYYQLAPELVKHPWWRWSLYGILVYRYPVLWKHHLTDKTIHDLYILMVPKHTSNTRNLHFITIPLCI